MSLCHCHCHCLCLSHSPKWVMTVLTRSSMHRLLSNSHKPHPRPSLNTPWPSLLPHAPTCHTNLPFPGFNLTFSGLMYYFHCYNRIIEAIYWINKRGLCSPRFCRFKGMTLALATLMRASLSALQGGWHHGERMCWRKRWCGVTGTQNVKKGQAFPLSTNWGFHENCVHSFLKRCPNDFPSGLTSPRFHHNLITLRTKLSCLQPFQNTLKSYLNCSIL